MNEDSDNLNLNFRCCLCYCLRILLAKGIVNVTFGYLRSIEHRTVIAAERHILLHAEHKIWVGDKVSPECDDDVVVFVYLVDSLFG